MNRRQVGVFPPIEAVFMKLSLTLVGLWLAGCGSTGSVNAPNPPGPPPPGSQTPTISNVAVGNTTPSSAAITWTTNIAASSQVEYGTSSSYGASTSLDSSLSTQHSQTISGLTAATQYHYRVHSHVGSNPEALSGDLTFTTGSPSDTTPPVISAIMVSPDGNAAFVSWITD